MSVHGHDYAILMSHSTTISSPLIWCISRSGFHSQVLHQLQSAPSLYEVLISSSNSSCFAWLSIHGVHLLHLNATCCIGLANISHMYISKLSHSSLHYRPFVLKLTYLTIIIIIIIIIIITRRAAWGVLTKALLARTEDTVCGSCTLCFGWQYWSTEWIEVQVERSNK